MESILRRLSVGVLALMVLGFAGCGGTTGTTASSTNDPSNFTGDYLLIDLTSWSVTTLANPQVNPSTLTSSQLALKHVTGRLYCGVFEVTRGQWKKVMTTQPWSVLPSSATASANSDWMPATNISWADAKLFADTLAARCSLPIRLPSQTELTSTFGSTAEFPWGASSETAVVENYALVNETHATNGPGIVGQRQPTSFGIYDVIGNAREWTVEQTLVGGSWSDNVLTSGRSVALTSVQPSIEHPCSGFRVVTNH